MQPAEASASPGDPEQQDTERMARARAARFRPAEGLRRYAGLASFWSTIGWNVIGPNRRASIFVLGAPRTGTNWFARIISHYFDLPRYLPNDQPLPVLRPAVLHLHRFLVAPQRTLYVVRDPRDVAVSYYHKIANVARPSLRARIDRELPLPYVHENLERNLAAWIRLAYTTNVGGSIAFDRHVRKASAMGLHRVRYEDLLERGEATVAEAVRHLTGAPADADRVRAALEDTSFEKRTGRRRGEERLDWLSVRKGVAGDWKNHFDREAALELLRLDPTSLIDLGYERDDAWVSTLPG